MQQAAFSTGSTRRCPPGGHLVRGGCVMRKLIIAMAGLAAAIPASASAQGYYYPGRQPYAYGHYERDVAREIRECRRELRRADSRREYRQELRECRREIR